MYAEERQHEIAALARERGRVSVADLAGRYDVTPETIRRDLDALSALGVLSRVHGGAVPAEKLRLAEASVPTREISSTQEKLAIARAAAALIPPREGVTVLLDAGTTTARICDLLPPQVGTVVTNSVPSAGVLVNRSGTGDVWLLGGLVRGITQSTVGPSALEALARLHVDIAFMGANGFSVEHGFSTPDAAEAAVKRAMVASARQVVVCADSSKLGADYLISFAGLADVDVLVTDTGLPAAVARQFKQEGVEVVLA